MSMAALTITSITPQGKPCCIFRILEECTFLLLVTKGALGIVLPIALIAQLAS